MELGLAIAPCLIGYGQIGNRLYNDPNTVKGDANPYWEWIKNYHDSNYQDAVERGIGRSLTIFELRSSFGSIDLQFQ